MRVLVMVCVAVLLAGCGKKATSTGAPARAVTHKPALSTAKAVGQTLIASYPSAAPPPALLSAIRAGHVGGVIMMGANTPSISTARAAADKLQAAAKAGHNPPLLIMTDQEGGEIERLQGQPPVASAAQMGTESAAAVKRLGERTGAVLRRAGINMDLAPDADVARVPSGFIATEKRSFGTTPAVAARGACSFAAGLSAARIGYTLKHYPGLGSDPADASHSTDTEPNTVTEPAAEIHADDAAYRECGNGAVMLSSASYPALSGRAPAVLSRSIYAKTLRGDHVHGLLISDTFTGGAIKNQRTPAKTAISLGLDMVMYPDTMSSGLGAYGSLLADVKSGSLGAARVQAAAAKVLAYKKALGLGS